MLIEATDYLDRHYAWRGYKQKETSGLEFPRLNLYYQNGVAVSNETPIKIKRACVELALIGSKQKLTTDIDNTKGAVIREKIDVIDTAYSNNGANVYLQQVIFTSIDNLVREFASNLGGPVTLQRG